MKFKLTLLNVILAALILAYTEYGATDSLQGSGDGVEIDYNQLQDGSTGSTDGEGATTSDIDMAESGSGSAFSGEGIDDSLSNVSCVERNIALSSVPLYSQTLTNIVKSFRIIYFSLLFVCSVPLNIFILFLVIKYKKLHTLSFTIVLQVIVLNLLFSTFVFLPIIVTAAADEWLFGKYMCILTGFVAFYVLMVRTALLLVFVIDRFLSVYFPFFYPKYNVKIMLSLSVLCWVLILILNSLGLPGILDCYTYITSAQFCNISVSCSQACSIYGNTYFIALGLPGTISPLFLYGALYLKARRLRKDTAATMSGLSANAQAVRKQEWRATITFFFLFISVFAITIPTTSIGIIISRVSSSFELPPPLFIVQAIAGGLSTFIVLTDPIVLMRNRDVREIIAEIKVSVIRKMCPRFLPKQGGQE